MNVQIDRETANILSGAVDARLWEAKCAHDPSAVAVLTLARDSLYAALDAPQPPAVSGHGKLVDEILSIAHAFGDEGRKEAIRDLAMRVSNALAPQPPPDPREAFETDAAARGHDVTRLGDSYARLETHLRWRGFQAGFAAGRGSR